MNPHLPTDPLPDAAVLLSAERCARLRDAFDLALEQPDTQRAAWIARHIPDPDDRAAMHLLLHAEAGAGPLDMPSSERILRIGEEPELLADALVGQRIGAFRLLRLLGQGGMAAVFLGEREGAQFAQHVAVKLLQRGLYSAIEQRLFRREQQALAALSHPNIAHLIDGGVSEAGIPYLVLEYVDGVALTQFAADRKLALRQRLQLFVVVCRAVAAAHRQLIVHRDIKPSNILVDGDGQVKLLDFGIAKFLAEDDDGATRNGLGVLTPGYAAPEQYAGDAITTATDVYALGIVLRELLLGGRIEEGDSQRPSALLQDADRVTWPLPLPRMQLRAALRGDLDNIVSKALAAEPERRYAAASELADDIERHLDGKPVRAHPPSGWYRTRKFVRRHRGSVVLTSMFAIGVLTSLGIAVWQANVARLETANARAEAQRANTTRAFLENLFEPVDSQLAEGGMPSLRDLVSAGAAQLDAATGLAPAQRIDLLLLFSRLQSKLAEPERAMALAERAHADAVAALPAQSPLALQAMFALARARQRAENAEAAEPLLREVERGFVAQGVTGPDLIELLAVLASVENELGRPDEALRYAQREFDARLAHYGADAPQMASGYNNLGYALEAVSRFDEAIAAYRQTLAIDSRTLDPRSLQRTLPLGNLAQAEFNAGHLLDARAHFSESLAIHADVALEKPSWSLLSQLGIHVMNEFALGAFDRAAAGLEQYRVVAESVPPTRNDRAVVRRLDAALAFEQGRIDAARSGIAAARALSEPLDAFTRSRMHARTAGMLGEIALLEGDADAAAALLAESLAGMGTKIYPIYVVPYTQALLALACTTSRAAACAGDPLPAAVDALDGPYLREHPAMLGAQVALARAQLHAGDVAAATARLRAAIDAATTRGVESDSPRLAQANAWLALAHARAGICDAAATARDAVRMHSSTHPLVLEAAPAWRESGCEL